MGCFSSTRKTVIELNQQNKPTSPNGRKILSSEAVEEDIIVMNTKHYGTSKGISENIKIKNLITRRESNVEDNYKVLSRLGQGSFGSVFKVLHIHTGIIRAMKVIKRENLTYQDDDQKFLKEIEILILAEHPNIIRIFEYFFDNINFYLITEYVSGGELYDTILKWKNFDEEKAAYIMSQILSAVNYLHKKGIVHRDIKPENMLVENKIKNEKSNKELINIKLIDFGTCNFISSKNLTLKVGSPYYIAPEVLRRNYNEKCDIWSCGVILYILLVGYPPFSGSNTNELLANVAKGEYSLKNSEWNRVSAPAKNLVVQMLELNPSKRISAEQALDHPWLKNIETNEVDNNYYTSVLKKIYEFNAREKLQQATLAYIVHFVFTSQETDDLKKIFKKIDNDGDGKLTYTELQNALETHLGKYKTDSELIHLMQFVDADNDGYISYEEFLRVTIDQNKLLDAKNLKLAFDRFDLDKDGKLSKEEVKTVLGTTELEYINILLSTIDNNKDGYINFEEFCNLMNGVISKSVTETITETKTNEDYTNTNAFLTISVPNSGTGNIPEILQMKNDNNEEGNLKKEKHSGDIKVEKRTSSKKLSTPKRQLEEQELFDQYLSSDQSSSEENNEK